MPKLISAPVHYADGLYYIGTDSSPAWLLESTEGLILIDSAMPSDLDHLLAGISALGHDAKDIKHIIHSHSHIDHIGCTRALVLISGARTYIGSGDEDSAAGRNELQWTNEYNMSYDGKFEPDVIIKDNDEIKIGDRLFNFIACPGHTRGVLSIFFNVCYNGKEYRAGMFGGAGLKSMELEYLEKYSLPRSLRDDFINSIDKVMNEHVEIHLGNHLGDNMHRFKVKEISAEHNPFIDPDSWQGFLKKRRLEAIEYFKEH